MSTAFKQLKDNAVSTTSTVLTSTGVTSIAVATGDGAKFPSPGNGFRLTIWTGNVGSDPGSDSNMEIVTCSARSTDTLTISATTKTHAAPVNVALTVNAEDMGDMQTAINNIETGATTLSAVKTSVVNDTNGNEILSLAGQASAVNYVEVQNSATGFAPAIVAKGTDTNLNLFFRGKGTGSAILADSTGNAVLTATPNGSTPANYVNVVNSTTTNPPQIQALGTDTNIDLSLVPKGTGRVKLNADPTSSLHAATKQYVDNQATSVSSVSNEVPGGSVNGSNTAFTTASAFATNSLKVTRNGIRLKSGVDFTPGSSAFTMTTAPASNDILLVDYNVSSTGFSVGTNSIISGEVPSGSINGSNTTFTLSRAYIAGSLLVYQNRTVLLRGSDYTETTPGSGIFTFTAAPPSNATVWCDYQYNLNPSSNADTVDGIHGSTTFGNDGQLVPDYGGWLLAAGTFTYSSPTVMNTPSDLTGWLAVGDKIRWKHAGGYLYGHIIVISSTQITLVANADYAVANSAISSVYVSKALTPVGFPQWFNWTPTLTGWSANPTNTVYRYTITARTVNIRVRQATNGTSNSTSIAITAPTAAANVSANGYSGGNTWECVDNGAAISTVGACYIPDNSTTISVIKDNANVWTATGGKRCSFNLVYEI